MQEDFVSLFLRTYGSVTNSKELLRHLVACVYGSASDAVSLKPSHWQKKVCISFSRVCFFVYLCLFLCFFFLSFFRIFNLTICKWVTCTIFFAHTPWVLELYSHDGTATAAARVASRAMGTKVSVWRSIRSGAAFVFALLRIIIIWHTTTHKHVRALTHPHKNILTRARLSFLSLWFFCIKCITATSILLFLPACCCERVRSKRRSCRHSRHVDTLHWQTASAFKSNCVLWGGTISWNQSSHSRVTVAAAGKSCYSHFIPFRSIKSY